MIQILLGCGRGKGRRSSLGVGLRFWSWAAEGTSPGSGEKRDFVGSVMGALSRP